MDRRLGVTKNSTYNLVHGIGERLSKPSVDYVQKVLSTFPELDARWWLLGIGDMLTPEKVNIEYVKDLEMKLEEKTNEAQAFMFSLQMAARNYGNTPNFYPVSMETPVNEKVIIFANSRANMAS